MTIKNNTVWVFDLDDTLYYERDYQHSGFNAIAEYIQRCLNHDVSYVIEDALKNKQDVLAQVCEHLHTPTSVKESLLWIYRIHMPNIELTQSTKQTLNTIKQQAANVAILTDGRLITQRAKLTALGLSDWKAYVSEEWGETKPGRKRFEAVMQDNPSVTEFVYVGDNIKKDFITPNQLGWMTIGLKDTGRNIHPQRLEAVGEDFLPKKWIHSIADLLL
ncbi:MAG: HAD family hydrolase [Glaciecola sp.]